MSEIEIGLGSNRDAPPFLEQQNVVSRKSMPAADQGSEAPVAPGDVLAGKYRVERVLGVGGMGVVVSALHLELGDRVAMKFLLPECSKNPEAAARFLREARAAARIKSDYVARVIDVGRLESGAPYMVMEYLDGCDLGAHVEQGRLPVEEAVDYVIQACHAMAEAHALGIVHRDLKPANLFLTQRSDGSRVVKVLDFGISKSQQELGDASLTKTSTMMGSPYYMSPEQMRSARDVDHRTDIWALGVVLYQLLAGVTPFQGDTLPELLTRIMTDTPPSLCGARPEVPGELDAVVFRCLEKSPLARYKHVGELARALNPFASRRGRYTVEGVLKITGLTDTVEASLPPARDLDVTAAAGGSSKRPASIGGQTSTSWVDTQQPHSAPKGRAKWYVLGASAVGVTAALALGSLLPRTAEHESAQPPASAAAVKASAAQTLQLPESAREVAARIEPAASASAPLPAVSGSALAAAEPSVSALPSDAAPTRAGSKVAPAKRVNAPTTAPPKSEPTREPPPEPVREAPKEPARVEPAPKKNPLAIELK